MTREEREQAISEFISFKEHNYNHGYLPSSWSIEMAIKALQQEPCDDCISRQAAIDVLNINRNPVFHDSVDYEGAMYDICKLPSVTPAEKVGQWKEVYAETDYHNGWIEFSCENCEYQHGLESGEYEWHFGDPIPWKYCPMCGAKMQEVDE